MKSKQCVAHKSISKSLATGELPRSKESLGFFLYISLLKFTGTPKSIMVELLRRDLDWGYDQVLSGQVSIAVVPKLRVKTPLGLKRPFTGVVYQISTL